jgi:hypothetical protein
MPPRSLALLTATCGLCAGLSGAAAQGNAVASTLGGDRTVDLAAGVADVLIVGTSNKDQLGNDMRAGDVNADGLVDLVLGAHWSSGSGRNIVGRSYVLFGRTAWPTRLDMESGPSISWAFYGAGREARMGSAVAMADVSGDRTADVLLGSLMADPFDQHNGGAVYLMLGGRTAGGAVDFRDTAADGLLAGDSRTQDSDQLGTDLATGDFNGDHRADVAVAAALRNSGAGAVFVWFGPLGKGTLRNLRQTPADWALIGPGPSNWFGAAIAAGDVDGDGVDDLAVSAINTGRGDGPPDGGVIHVFHGGPTARGTVYVHDTAADTTVWGRPKSMLGVAMSLGTCSCRGRPILVADATGEGRSDLVLGAPLDAGRRGTVAVLPGPITSRTVDLASVPQTRLIGTLPEGRLGWWLEAGHLDGDGTADLLVAAPWAGIAARDKTGVVYGLRGPIAPATTVTLTDGVAPLAVLGPGVSSGNAGTTLVLADTNGDGTDDLHLGFPDDAPLGRNSAGGAYIVRGPVLDTLATPTPTPSATGTATGPPAPSATPSPGATDGGTPTAGPSSTPTPPDVPPPSPTPGVGTPTPATAIPTTTPLRRTAYLPMVVRGD